MLYGTSHYFSTSENMTRKQTGKEKTDRRLIKISHSGRPISAYRPLYSLKFKFIVLKNKKEKETV